jgi:hypothetical protein
MPKRTTSLRPTAPPRRALLAGVVALVAIATSGAARAETRSVGVSLRGVACPGAEAVVTALAEVLVHTEIRQVDGPTDIVIEATDADVRVTAFGTTKRFSGSDERVRLLSAYVALGLEPPMPIPPVEPPAESPAAPPLRALPPPTPQDPKKRSPNARKGRPSRRRLARSAFQKRPDMAARSRPSSACAARSGWARSRWCSEGASLFPTR